MERTRTTEATVIWILSALLAAWFVIIGIGKLTGTEPVALQAAAMNGFPQWVRALVGGAQVILGVALLATPVAAIAALLLTVLMIPAAITQWVSGQPGAAVPVLLMGLLLLVAWRRSPAVARAGYDAAVHTPRPLLREGVIVGALGATAIAVWFLIVDLVAGQAFFTPLTLGGGLFALFGADTAAINGIIIVGVYTLVHYAAFALVGISAALIVDMANRQPSILFGFVVLFAVIELGFYAFASLLQQITALGNLAWYNVMAGNVLAAVVMGYYLVRAHPALREQFRHSLDGVT